MALRSHSLPASGALLQCSHSELWGRRISSYSQPGQHSKRLSFKNKSKNKPKDYDKYVKSEDKILRLFERIGQVLVTCLSLIFSDFNIIKISSWTIVLLIAFILMILYEIYWIRYFRSNKTMKDMYCSLFGENKSLQRGKALDYK